MLAELWRHRAFVLSGAWHELRQRYAGSAMGVLWHVVTPLAQIVVYYAVFSRFMGARAQAHSDGAYALFLCAGILPWFVFVEAVTAAAARPCSRTRATSRSWRCPSPSSSRAPSPRPR